MQNSFNSETSKVCTACYCIAGNASFSNDSDSIQKIGDIALQIKTEVTDDPLESVFIENLNVKSEIQLEESPKCMICGLCVRNNVELQQHSLIHNSGDNNDIKIPKLVQSDVNLFKPHACNACEKSFTCRAALRRHLMIHTGLNTNEKVQHLKLWIF